MNSQNQSLKISRFFQRTRFSYFILLQKIYIRSTKGYNHRNIFSKNYEQIGHKLIGWNIIRNENSAYGSISLTLGIISFIIGFIGTIFYFTIVVMLMGWVLMFVIPLVTVIYGIIGMVKDNKIPLAIVGLNLGIAYLIILAINFIMISPFI